MEIIETINNVTAFIADFDNLLKTLADSVSNLIGTISDTVSQLI